jgi:hypothetical protein
MCVGACVREQRSGRKETESKEIATKRGEGRWKTDRYIEKELKFGEQFGPKSIKAISRV